MGAPQPPPPPWLFWGHVPAGAPRPGADLSLQDWAPGLAQGVSGGQREPEPGDTGVLRGWCLWRSEPSSAASCGTSRGHSTDPAPSVSSLPSGVGNIWSRDCPRSCLAPGGGACPPPETGVWPAGAAACVLPAHLVSALCLLLRSEFTVFPGPLWGWLPLRPSPPAEELLPRPGAQPPPVF